MTEPKCPICSATSNIVYSTDGEVYCGKCEHDEFMKKVTFVDLNNQKCHACDPELYVIYGWCPECKRECYPPLKNVDIPVIVHIKEKIKPLEELTAQAQEMGLSYNPGKEIWPHKPPENLDGTFNMDDIPERDFPFGPIPHLRKLLNEFVRFVNKSCFCDGNIYNAEQTIEAFLQELLEEPAND